MIKLFLFDFDGTTLDSDKMIEITFRQLFEKYRPDYNPSSEYLLKYSGPPIRESLSYEFPFLDIDFIDEEWHKLSKKNYDEYTALYPHVLEMFKTFKEHGIKAGIITSKSRWATDHALNIHGLTPYVDFVLTRDEVKEKKPNPEGVFLAMKTFNVDNKDEVLYVGDNMIDYKTARNASVKFAHVSFSPRPLDEGCKADMIVDNYVDFVQDVLNERI